MPPEGALAPQGADGDEDGFGPEAVKAAVGATSAQLADLQRFRAVLEAANANMNLVGPSAMASFWRRHVLDSAQLLALAPHAVTWADLGAGAGFPGLVLAILLKGQPGAQVHLVESQAKRCRFLRGVVDELELPAQVHWARAEDMVAPAVDIVTARACAPLARLFAYALPFTSTGARGLFLKGQAAPSEIAEAKAQGWRFTAGLIPSLSDETGRIVSVEGLRRG